MTTMNFTSGVSAAAAGRIHPAWLRPIAYATPLWHGAALCRSLSLGTVTAGSAAIHVGYLAAMAAIGLWFGNRSYYRKLYV